MEATIKIAVIGFGRMGQVYAHTIRQIPGTQLYAVADPSEKARSSAQETYAVQKVSAEPLEVIGLPEVDAVIITTPTSTHSRLVIAAAQAGKAIFCEKPLALSLEDSQAALEAVEKAGVPLQMGFMRRFDPAYQKAKALIEKGEIGFPVTFKAVGRDPFCPNPEFADPAKSGGLIIDMGIHDFDLARWLVGSEVTRVSTEGTLLVCDVLKAIGDIDNAVVNLRFASGALGNVEVSRNAFYGYDIRTEILGSEGAINIGVYQHTPVLLLTRHGAQHDVTPYLMERFGEAYRAQIQHFVDCLRNSKTPAVTGRDAVAAFEIGLAATRSYQTGQPVTLAELRKS